MTSEGSSSQPVPSDHIFLYEVAKQATGSKVRFLGCVVNYDIIKGVLQVQHRYPKDVLPIPQVAVDIRLVLETIKAEVLEMGCWINVIGYVRRPDSSQRKSKRQGSESATAANTVAVQAVLLWNAGAIKVGNYEEIVSQQKEMRSFLESETAQPA